MEFNYSDEQKMFRDTVYRFAREELAPLSEESDLKGEFNFDIWRKMATWACSVFPSRRNTADRERIS